MKKRKVDIVVISDVHLGTYGCRAKELLQYMKSIAPDHVILNGDIIDIWQFNKRFWPKSHMKVIRHILKWVSQGVKVDYITGNHDEMLRKFEGFEMGTFSIQNKLVLPLPNFKKAWIFHGDVFDITMQHSRWLVKLGAKGYDALILINTLANFISDKVFNKGKISLSKKIKSGVKSAVKYINSFEDTAAKIGIENKYDYVVCGHIHQPEIKKIETIYGKIEYLNSGDWIENLTALEYHNQEWSIYEHKEFEDQDPKDSESEILDSKILFQQLLSEFKIVLP